MPSLFLAKKWLIILKIEKKLRKIYIHIYTHIKLDIALNNNRGVIYSRSHNVYVSNNWVSRYKRQNSLELQERDKSTIIVGEFNSSFSNDMYSRKKTNDVVELNGIFNKLDLINIYRIFYPTRK